MFGWSALAVGALALWTLIALGIGLMIGRMIRQSETQHELTELHDELSRLERRQARRVSTAPPGRRGAETSQLPGLGPDGYRVRPPLPQPLPQPQAEPPTQQLRRVDDRPGEPLRPPLPGGRRRSDERQTRTAARRLRNGSDDDDDVTDD